MALRRMVEARRMGRSLRSRPRLLALRVSSPPQARGLVRPFEFDSPQGILIKNGPVALMRTDPQVVWWSQR